MSDPTLQGVLLHLTDPTDSLKMLRETLSAVQHGASGLDRAKHAARVGRIIAEIDRQRPLGSNGKHGDLHTPMCGCQDRPAPKGERPCHLPATAPPCVGGACPAERSEPTEAAVRAAALAMYHRQNSLSMSGATTLARAALRAAAQVGAGQ